MNIAWLNKQSGMLISLEAGKKQAKKKTNEQKKKKSGGLHVLVESV